MTVIDVLNVRYPDNNILKLSTVMDPRFKFHHVLSDHGNGEIKKMMANYCLRAWSHWISKNNITCDEPPIRKKLTGLSAIFDFDVESQTNPGVSSNYMC